MGSRIFFYFLPGAKKIDLSTVISVMEKRGMSFDTTAYLDYYDENRELLSSSEKSVELSQIPGLLEQEDYVDIGFGNQDMFATASFGSPHNPPIFTLMISKRQWNMTHLRYEPFLIEIAKQSGAMAVLKIYEAFEDFFCGIINVDGTWVIDMEYTPFMLAGKTYSAYPPSKIWVDESEPLPEMRNLQPTGRKIQNFVEFFEDAER